MCSDFRIRLNVNMARTLYLTLIVLGFAASLKLLFEHQGLYQTKESYMKSRDIFLQRENLQRTGGSIVLTPQEQAVSSKLMAFKNQEISSYRIAKDGYQFPPAVSFLRSKQHIEESEVFKLIKLMPKGAALHVHDMGIADLSWVISELTYNPNCYMCINQQDNLQLGFFDKAPLTQDCNWRSVNDARQEFSNATAFDNLLHQNMSMITSRPDVFTSQESIWAQFLACFTALQGLFFSEIGFKAFVNKGLQEFYDDNVQYVELRSLYSNVSRIDGSTYPVTWLLESYANISAEFTKKHPDFKGITNIMTIIRSQNASEVAEGLQQVLSWKEKFPEQIVGFDLVGHEDPGHTLVYFIDQLLQASDRKNLPYMFHAGETNWIGEDVDSNLIDAVLLNATRIGHGYALAHHPEVLQHVWKNNIAIELNPISNQVLGLVSDLRNHPGAMLLALGIPAVISSDDPNLWGASGLSYDFYETFMGLTGAWGDLATLKTLAMDSIKYSGLTAEAKQSTLVIWQKKWQEFLDKMVIKYKLKY